MRSAANLPPAVAIDARLAASVIPSAWGGAPASGAASKNSAARSEERSVASTAEARSGATTS